VTTVSARSNPSNSGRNRAISLVVASTSAWARTARLVWSITASKWTGDLGWWPLPRRVLPSTATARRGWAPAAAGSVAAGRPARRRWRGPGRRGRRRPARGARSPRRVSARRPSTGGGAPPARPGRARARPRPTRRSRPGTWPPPARRPPPRPAPRPACAAGRVAVWGRRAGRGDRADLGTGRVPAQRARPAAGQPPQRGMMSRHGRSGPVWSWAWRPHDRGEPCLPPHPRGSLEVSVMLGASDVRRPDHSRASKLPSRSGLVVTSPTPDWWAGDVKGCRCGVCLDCVHGGPTRGASHERC
jgi:hypothetical protein